MAELKADVRPPRCGADAGAGRTGAADGAQAVSLGRAASTPGAPRHPGLWFDFGPSTMARRTEPCPAPAGGNDDRKAPLGDATPFAGRTVWLTMWDEWGFSWGVLSLRDSASRGDTAASH